MVNLKIGAVQRRFFGKIGVCSEIDENNMDSWTMRRLSSVRERVPFRWGLVLCVLCIYFWQWHAMPLFPDEVTFRINKCRFFIDRGVGYGSFAECLSNIKTVPLFYYPAAAILAKIGELPAWKFIRVIPFLSIAALTGAVYIFDKKTKRSRYIPFLFLAGFIGVSGSGFVLSRHEIYLIFHAAICLTALSFCYDGTISRYKGAVLLLLLYIVSLISFYAHMQGIIFAPLTLILMLKISQSYGRYAGRILSILSGIYIGAAMWYGLVAERFKCPESPKTVQFISAMSLPGWLKTSGTIDLSAFINHELSVILSYFKRLVFSPKSQINYLPSIDFYNLQPAWLMHLVNFMIIVVSGSVFLAFLALCVYMMLRIVLTIIRLIKDTGSRFRKLKSLAFSYEFAFMLTCWAHLCLLFYDTQLNFYRVFYINLAMVVMLIATCARIKNKNVQRIAAAIGLFSFFLCGASAKIANQYVAPRLESGYAGPSLPLKTDWEQVHGRVQSLKNMCDITDEDTGIIVDDMTYDALKTNQHVFSFTYLGLSSQLTGRSVISIINDTDANSAIARCAYFRTYNLTPRYIIDDLCCTTFKQNREISHIPALN